MALTPEKIAAFNKITGVNAPLDGSTGTKTRGDQIRQIAEKAKTAQQPVEEKESTLGSFAKNLVRAPATMLARPLQAVARATGELAGQDLTEEIDKFSDKYSGGIVAPTPKNFGDVKKDVGRGVQTVAFGLNPVAGGAVFGAGNSLEQGNDLLSVQTALQTALGAAGGKVLDLVGKPLFNAAGKAVGKVTPEFLSNLASKGTKAVEEFAAAHDILPDFASKAVNKTADKINALGEGASNIVDAGIDKTKQLAMKTKEGFVPTPTAEEATGHIIQGETSDIPAAKRALSSIDGIENSKTYKEALDKVNNEIKPIAEKVDVELEKGGRKGQSIKSFERTVGEGKAGVKVNHVEQALNDLRTYYTKTNDAAGLARIKAIENNARIKGMSFKDVNELAKLHGRTIKAFNANGEAASGLSKQAAENTRTGLKSLAREAITGKEAQALDAKLSDLYHVQSLLEDMVEKVNKASQKTVKKGIIPETLNKTVGGIVRAVDAVTGNPLKAIGKEIGLGGGNSAMSPVELEKNLMKYLRILRGK